MQGGHHGLDGPLADQRAHQHRLVPGIADLHSRIDLDQPLEHRVVDRFVNDQAAGGRAALARGPDRGEGRGPDRQLEVGARGDDDGVVSAQLQERPAEPAADDFADAPAHPAATGRRNQGETVILDHPLADVVGPADAEVEDPLAAVGLGHVV